MKPLVGVMCAALAVCEGPPLVVGDLPDAGHGGGTGGGAAVLCAGGCSSGGTCISTSTNTTAACGFDGGLCVDCSSSVLHASLVSCSTGTCDYFACETGWSNCDDDRSNGCERNVSACFDVLVPDQLGPTHVQSDGVDIYWRVEDGTIRKVARTGGPHTDIAVTTGAFQLDGNNLYLITDTTISVMPKTGGTPMPVLTTSPAFESIITDGVSWFWVTRTPDNQMQIKAAPISGGAESLLVGGVQKQIRHLTAIDGDLLFVVELDILKVPKAGGVVSRVASVPPNPASYFDNAVVLMRDRVYWGRTTKLGQHGPVPAVAAVFTMQYGESTPTRLADLTYAPARIVVDGAFIFVEGVRDFTTSGFSAVLRVPISGGRVDILASGQSPRMWLTPVADTLYWAEWRFIGPHIGDIRKTSKNP